MPQGSSQSPRRSADRLIIAIGFGLIAGAVVYVGFEGAPTIAGDWDQCWYAARALVAGDDPYAAVTEKISRWPLLYPMPAVLLAVPLAGFPLPLARAAWFAVGAACLAYAWSGERWRLWGLLSGALWWAALGAQWTPLLVSSVWLPALATLLVAKPTTGLALFLHQPRRVAVLGGLGLLAVSFVLMPRWILSWREAVGGMYHAPLLSRPGGVILLAALFRWRLPEARLLAALAAIPTAAMPYELLLLYPIAKARWQWYTLTALTLAIAAYGIHVVGNVPGGTHASVIANRLWPVMFGLAYFPALVVVLSRQNREAPANAMHSVESDP